MNKSVFKIIVLIFIVFLISIVVFFFLQRKKNGIKFDSEIKIEDTIVSEFEKQDIILRKERKAPPISQTDKDSDGVDDALELELGTSIENNDTDGDGISDKEEIEKWQTDPTKKDTDGDGYADLFEIINGYNPSGEGALQ